MPLADTLLQLAEAGHYQPTWSATLLEETGRNLASKMGLQPARAARRIELMRQAFPWAEADPLPELIEAMTVDAKDRHVAATAVTVGAALIVTYNLKDFPDEALAPYGIRAIHPDEFLLDLLDLDPHGVATALDQQRRRLKSPAMTAAAFQQALAVNVPHFAAELAALPAPSEDRSEGTTGSTDMPMPIVSRTPEEISEAFFPGGQPDALTPEGVIALWYTAAVQFDHPESLTTLTRLSYNPAHWGDYSEIAALASRHSLTQARHPDVDFPDIICYFKLIQSDVGGQVFAAHLIQDPVLWVMLARNDLYEPWRVLAVGRQPWIDLPSDAGGPAPMGEVPRR
jgi:hypothetical protein